MKMPISSRRVEPKRESDATDKARPSHDRCVEAGRIIQELTNVTTDEDTKAKAKEDAHYFFEKAKEIK